MKQRLYLSVLQEIDNFYQDDEENQSNIRSIEMLVDRITENNGYSVQFWHDVQTYGLREAIMYLKNHKPKVNYKELMMAYEKCVKLAATI